MKIELLCFGCKKRVGLKPGDAVVHVRLADADAYGEAIKAWMAAHSGSISGDAWNTIPRKPGWAIHCNDCNPHWNQDRTEACVGCYWFDATRANSVERLLGWTAHLMEKRWLGWTRWDDFICRFGEDA